MIWKRQHFFAVFQLMKFMQYQSNERYGKKWNLKPSQAGSLVFVETLG